jgi:hypothetical protein
LRFVKRHQTALASTTALLVGASTLVAFALTSNGYPVQHVALHDGGIWVTNNSEDLFGRINKPAGALDGAFNPPGGARSSSNLDVSQDGAAVVARDLAEGKLYAVDVNRAVVLTDQAVPVQSADAVQIAGGSLAVLDPSTGKVWAQRVSSDTGISSVSAVAPASATPVAALPRSSGKAALAVGQDGTVYAAGTSGDVVTVHPSGAGFAKAVRSRLGTTFQNLALTVVGSTLVGFDRNTGALATSTGGSYSVTDGASGGVLQQPGPAADAVLLATSEKLFAVSLSDGKVSTLSTAGTGKAAAPAVLGSCVYAAWAGRPGSYARGCDRGPAKSLPLGGGRPSLTDPIFRLNRSSIVLNDVANGAVWDVDNQRKVDDWSAVKPPPIQSNSDKTKNNDVSLNTQNQKPDVRPDLLGARPGRTTVLHVLDNDSDPAGNILSVVGISPPSNPAAKLAIAPDGQSVVLALPVGSGDLSFTYTVNDGKGPNATGNVSVQARGPGDNKPPNQRPGFRDQAWAVASGGHLSLPVLEDWRDYDGDPVALTDATTTGGSVTTRPDGRIDFTAPATGGPQTITYHVSDGLSAPVAHSFTINVSGPADTKTIPATAEPDVVQGQAGQPIDVHPLDNDLPGADPGSPTARLTLAGAVAQPEGLKVDTDVRLGKLSVTASHPGIFLLSYRAAYGNAPFADGKIRVNVTPATATAAPPVAMPDTAVLHGQAPLLLDVLANDYDPSGKVLAVQSATAASNTGQLQIAVLAGHWLRIKALSADLGTPPALIHYTVTDGVSAPVTGEVSVRQLPAVTTDTPVPQDDYATVRAGDSAAIPVLANDTNPGGDPITLATRVAGAGQGQLTVTGPDGTTGTKWGAAYVTGDLVRYVAPETVMTPQTVLVDYVAQDPAGDKATGHLHVSITPLPTPANPDHEPQPAAIEARVVAGDTVTIPVTTSGVDPDGDSVTVASIGSAPTLGRIARLGMSSLTYLAYPTNTGGTDEFSYLVSDRFGKLGTATVRIAVVAPGDPQPPVAVDDTVVAAPGTHLSIDVLRNDLLAPDDKVTILPLAANNPALPGGTKLVSPQGPVDVTAPGLTGKPLVVLYAITDGLGNPSIGTLTVRSEASHDIPPVAVDTDAKPSAKAASVTLDVLAKAVDPDGPSSGLQVSHVYASGASMPGGGRVTLRVLDHPQTVAYEIKDDGGATAAAVIHVRGVGAGTPYVKAGASITLDKGATKTVSLADYVVDPADKPVRLTITRNIWASPAAGLAVRNSGKDQLVLTGRPGYIGPAAVTFEATDGNSLTDISGQTAVLTIPVQVGPPTPVLRCPQAPITVVTGGPAVSVDIASVCHVWAPTPEQRDQLRFSGTFKGDSGALRLSGSGTRNLSVEAAGGAAPGATATLEVNARGTDATASELVFTVAAAAAPSITPVTVDGIKAGSSTTVDLRGYVSSPLRDANISVLQVNQTSGSGASASKQGSSVTLSPGDSSHGTMTFSVRVTDSSNTTLPGRQATGQITLHVLGKPDVPGVPQVGRTVLSKSVQLSWSTPANNGAPIDSYQVSYGSGTQTCTASPCLITGLTNGNSYTFTVKAHNLVGWSAESGSSGSAKPDKVPGSISGLRVSNLQDGSLLLSWSPAQNEGSALLPYQISYDNGGRTTAAGTATSATISGLQNDVIYTFTITPENQQGPGPAASVQGQSSGAPARPATPTFAASTDSAATRAVTVSWAADDPNGQAPTKYTLTRTGGSGTKTVCADRTATSCPDDGLPNDGTKYQYSVTASNATPGAGHISAPSGAVQMEATATPGPITNYTATATGVDGQVTLQFDVPPSYGSKSTVTCNGGSCGSWDFPTSGQSVVTKTINGLPNGQPASFTLQDCNGSTGSDAYAGSSCDAAVSQGATPYGPIRQPSVNPGAGNGTTANFSVSVDTNGKSATVTVQSARTNTSYRVFGTDTRSFSDDVGYDTNDGITVTVSDPGRQTMSASGTARSGPAPPPPPSGSVGVYQGAYVTKPGCTSNCQYIGVQTNGFSGSVTCTFDSSNGAGGFVQNQPYGANQRKDSWNWFGYHGGWVNVTCGGVSSGQVSWP